MIFSVGEFYHPTGYVSAPGDSLCSSGGSPRFLNRVCEFDSRRGNHHYFGCLRTVLVGAVASVPRWSPVGVLLAPGMLAGALIFPEGTKSDWPGVYMAIAAVMNTFFFSWPVLGIWILIERVRQ
jgi:hypothetical protein